MLGSEEKILRSIPRMYGDSTSQILFCYRYDSTLRMATDMRGIVAANLSSGEYSRKILVRTPRHSLTSYRPQIMRSKSRILDTKGQEARVEIDCAASFQCYGSRDYKMSHKGRWPTNLSLSLFRNQQVLPLRHAFHVCLSN